MIETCSTSRDGFRGITTGIFINTSSMSDNATNRYAITWYNICGITTSTIFGRKSRRGSLSIGDLTWIQWIDTSLHESTHDINRGYSLGRMGFGPGLHWIGTAPATHIHKVSTATLNILATPLSLFISLFHSLNCSLHSLYRTHTPFSLLGHLEWRVSVSFLTSVTVLHLDYTPGRGKIVPRNYYTPGRGKIVPRNAI